VHSVLYIAVQHQANAPATKIPREHKMYNQKTELEDDSVGEMSDYCRWSLISYWIDIVIIVLKQKNSYHVKLLIIFKKILNIIYLIVDNYVSEYQKTWSMYMWREGDECNSPMVTSLH